MEEQSHWMRKSLAQYSPILQHTTCDSLTPKEASKDKNVTKPRKKNRTNQFGDTIMGRSLGCKRGERQQQQALPENRAKQTRSG